MVKPKSKPNRLIHYADGTIKTAKGVPVVVVEQNNYQDEEDT